MKILDWFKIKFKKPITLTEFEHWTKLKYNDDNFNYEYKDLRVSWEVIRDAQKRGELENLARAIMETYKEFYA